MAEEETADEIDLSPERVAKLADANAELIDVRMDYEWEAGRLSQARHVEVNRLTAEAGSIPKDRPVVFYCRTGSRSGMAAQAFREAGWDAYHLDGGLMAWAAADLPLEPEDGEIADSRPPTA